jgi:hypothetical protein
MEKLSWQGIELTSSRGGEIVGIAIVCWANAGLRLGPKAANFPLEVDFSLTSERLMARGYLRIAQDK